MVSEIIALKPLSLTLSEILAQISVKTIPLKGVNQRQLKFTSSYSLLAHILKRLAVVLNSHDWNFRLYIIWALNVDQSRALGFSHSFGFRLFSRWLLSIKSVPIHPNRNVYRLFVTHFQILHNPIISMSLSILTKDSLAKNIHILPETVSGNMSFFAFTSFLYSTSYRIILNPALNSYAFGSIVDHLTLIDFSTTYSSGFQSNFEIIRLS